MTNNLKRTTSSISKLLDAINAQSAPAKKERPKDERYWKPTTDQAGNGSAVIRFLPAAADGSDALPWVRYWDHGFYGPTGKLYLEKSLKSIGKDDPVYKLNAKLYNKSEDPNSPERKQAANQKRRLNYVSNILVISDPKNPENEGKVFLYRYGKKIFDKISSMLNPEFADDTPVNPFDPVSGANFKMRIRQVSGFTNYDESRFDTPSAMNKAEVDSILSKTYSIQEIVDPKNFKTFEELQARLDEVLEETTSEAAPPKAAAKKAAPKEESYSDDDDEDLAAFRKLAAE